MRDSFQLEIGPHVWWAWACLVVVAPSCVYGLTLGIKGIVATLDVRRRSGPFTSRRSSRFFGGALYCIVTMTAAAALYFIFQQSFLNFHSAVLDRGSYAFRNYVGIEIGNVARGDISKVGFVQDGKRTGFVEIETREKNIFRSVRIDAPEGRNFAVKLQEWKVPNQLPDPTSPSVTPPAGAGGAPSVAADH
jgi:hypothetical protein